MSDQLSVRVYGRGIHPTGIQRRERRRQMGIIKEGFEGWKPMNWWRAFQSGTRAEAKPRDGNETQTTWGRKQGSLIKSARVRLEAVRERWAVLHDEGGWKPAGPLGQRGGHLSTAEGAWQWKMWRNRWFRKIGLAMVRGMNWGWRGWVKEIFICCICMCKTQELPVLRFSGTDS